MSRAKRRIEQQINDYLAQKLFIAGRKMIVEKQKNRYIKTSEYARLTHEQKRINLDKKYKEWFDSISSFFFSYNSIIALNFLVQRELKIRAFISEEVVRVKADYIFNDIEFSAYYPTHFKADMRREIDDCINELKSNKKHIVDRYTKRESERSPHTPLTTSTLKSNCFYIYNYEPQYTSQILDKLHEANLITYPYTNGWHITYEAAEDIITALMSFYNEESVLQHQRQFVDNVVDRSSECIRPVNITKRYFPKNVIVTPEFENIEFESEIEKRDALKIYEFIFYITLSTQMKNSLYDTSSLEIIVGNKKLTEQANIIIDGQENWELLTGHLMQKLQYGETGMKNKLVVLPELTAETILSPLDVYAYSYQSQRPPRYGIGRFMTQILAKNDIGRVEQHDAILNELLNSKAILQIKNMIHPQENAVLFIEWVREFMPTLLDFEYFKEINEKISIAANGEIDTSSIIAELDEIIDTGISASGISIEDTKPSKSKIYLIESIAMKEKIQVPSEVYESNIQADMFLAKHQTQQELIKIGKCPACNMFVYQKEYINRENGEISHYFACENFNKAGGCNFSLWDNTIYKFFSEKGLELFTIHERADALKKILTKKKGYLFNGLIGKNKKEYDAKIYLEEYRDNTNQKKWGFKMSFTRKGKE